MLFVLVPERNGVIFAAEHMQSRLALGIYHVCNGKSCLFQSNKVNFFL
jgi:hypothetical protein